MFKLALLGLVAVVLFQSAVLYLAASASRRRFWVRQALAGAVLLTAGVGVGLLIFFLPGWIPELAESLNTETLMLLFTAWFVFVLVNTIILLRRMRP